LCNHIIKTLFYCVIITCADTGFAPPETGVIAGKPEALAEGFSGIMRKDDIGVLVHDVSAVLSPEGFISYTDY